MHVVLVRTYQAVRRNFKQQRAVTFFPRIAFGDAQSAQLPKQQGGTGLCLVHTMDSWMYREESHTLVGALQLKVFDASPIHDLACGKPCQVRVCCIVNVSRRPLFHV